MYRKTPQVLARLADKRDAILTAAAAVAAARGLDDLTVHGVAAHAKVAVGTLYGHFPNLDEIVAALVAERLAGDLAAMKAAADLAAHQWADPLRGLGAAIAVYVHRLRASPRLTTSLTARPAYRTGIVRELERQIGRAASRGKIAKQSSAILAMGAYGAVNASILASMDDGSRRKHGPALVAMALRTAGVDNDQAWEIATMTSELVAA